MTDALARLHAALAGRYAIERELGRGGMATVYLARDVKHDRDVALKVLRPELAAVLGRERFLAEIRLTAKLDHPHILTLIDSGESDGFLWYVLPHVRGESLRDRLTRDKQLGVAEALAITKQIAGALEYAHLHGVIHRDIKPENILFHEGEAMLADFGIALAVKEAAGNRLTETGLSLGTPQYMSPEQATGDRQLDARSDIYSLAAVLYEMLAGDPPVTGSTVQAVIAKLMTERPTRLRVIRDTVPEGIDAAVAKALAKIPADRFGHASEFVEALGTSTRGAGRDWSKAYRLMAVIGVTALVAVASVVGWRVGRGHGGGRFVVQDRAQLTFTGDATYPAISADGKQVAYVAKHCTAGVCRSGIEVLDIGTGSARRIVDDVGGTSIVQWSRDRRFLLFNGMIGTRRASYLLSTLGGNPRSISTRYFNQVPTFVPSQDSLLLPLTNTIDSVVWVAEATLGGEYRDSVSIHLARAVQLATATMWPGSRWMVVETFDADGGRHEYRAVDRLGRQRDSIRVPADVGTWQIVRPNAFWMQLWTRGNPIIRVPFDEQEGRFSATWDTVLQVNPRPFPAGFDVTENGQSVVYSDGTVEYEVVALDLADALRGNFSRGHALHAGTSPELTRLSPDGTRVLVLEGMAFGSGAGSEILLLPVGGGNEIMHWAVDSLLDAHWMPDGRAFSYAERVAGRVRLVTVDARTGTYQSRVDIPDQVWRFAPLVDGSQAWISAPSLWNSGHVHLWRSDEREPRVLPLLQDEAGVGLLSAAPGQLRLASLAANASVDSILLDVTLLPEGQPTRWAVFRIGFSQLWWLADGSVMIWIQESENGGVLYRVRGPGRVERVGTIPRALLNVSLSRDGRRVVLVTRDFRGDVWLAHLKRTGGN